MHLWQNNCHSETISKRNMLIHKRLKKFCDYCSHLGKCMNMTACLSWKCAFGWWKLLATKLSPKLGKRFESWARRAQLHLRVSKHTCNLVMITQKIQPSKFVTCQAYVLSCLLIFVLRWGELIVKNVNDTDSHLILGHPARNFGPNLVSWKL